jgi:hypothetical protein
MKNINQHSPLISILFAGIISFISGIAIALIKNILHLPPFISLFLGGSILGITIAISLHLLNKIDINKTLSKSKGYINKLFSKEKR